MIYDQISHQQYITFKKFLAYILYETKFISLQVYILKHAYSKDNRIFMDR